MRRTLGIRQPVMTSDRVTTLIRLWPWLVRLSFTHAALMSGNLWKTRQQPCSLPFDLQPFSYQDITLRKASRPGTLAKKAAPLTERQ